MITMATGTEHDHEDDFVLWQRVTANVTPLNTTRRGAAASLADGDAQPHSSEKRRKKKPIRGVPTPPIVAPNGPKIAPIDLRTGAHAGLDKNTRKKLFRGDVPITARLDLHGFTAAQAERKLIAFITDAAHAGHRCVLVITGKGVRGDGVIRNSISGWLHKPALGSIVLAVANAKPADGGTGALYVLLRRRRS